MQFVSLRAGLIQPNSTSGEWSRPYMQFVSLRAGLIQPNSTKLDTFLQITGKLYDQMCLQTACSVFADKNCDLRPEAHG